MLSANESKLQFAQTNGIAIHTISTENYEEEIVQLNVSNSVKEDIKSAVSNGRIVIIPEETLHINQWSGSGYMVLDPDTYACGYMISGGLSGEAMTIEQVHAGTIVQSFNPGTLAVSEKKVETTFVKQTSELIHISLKNEMIDSTTNHPFYVLDRGFVKAKDLRAGDILCTVDGDYVVVEQVQHEILESPVNVYNFSVEDNHTYFVGKNGVGVHNGGCGDNSVKPEATVEGSKKHGVNWKEGSSRAKATGKPQGQWSAKDIPFATEKANTLGPGESAYFELPEGAESIVHMPDGTTLLEILK